MIDWVAPLLGGCCIGLSVGLNLVSRNRVLGASGLTNQCCEFKFTDRPSALGFIIGCLSIGIAFTYFSDLTFGVPSVIESSIYRYMIAGVCVGFGAKLANGCTSGHGLVGCARFSVRSFCAVGTFMLTAFITSNWNSPLLSDIKSVSGMHIVSAPFKNREFVYPAFLFGLTLVGAGYSLTLTKVRSFLASLNFTRETLEFLSALFFSSGFSVGLGVGGMLNQSTVLGAFNITGDWNVTLWILFCTALAVVTILVQVVFGSSVSNCGNPTGVTARLILGAAIFGIGWGAGGICPGPMVVGIPRIFLSGSERVFKLMGSFMLSYFVGVYLVRLFDQLYAQLRTHSFFRETLPEEEPLL